MSSINDKGKGPFNPQDGFSPADAEEAQSAPGVSSPLIPTDAKVQSITKEELSKLPTAELFTKHQMAISNYKVILERGDKVSELAKAEGLITTIPGPYYGPL